ncbi:MAG TPA: hypothetical protein VJ808_13525 [Gemmatimonadales bacterium]|nr:hypothetical protein [Gemmatimonadales bacterium]
MRLEYSISTFVLAATVACSSAESQSGLTVEKRLPSSFGTVSNVVELKDGRVVFAETKDKLFLRANFQSGEVDTLGRRVDSLPAGASADQYSFPGWVAHLAGDTVALVDFGGVRTTRWDERGRPIDVLPIKQVAGRTPVLLYDTVGHGYKIDYQAILGGSDPGTPVMPDSIPVLRIALEKGVVDTIARLAAPEYGDATFGEQVQVAAKVFAPNDHFGVLPDGTAWVARGHENRVDWRGPDGTWRRGEPREYSRLAVTQADKDRVLAQVRDQGKQFGMPQDLHIEYPFAETKPPFDFALGRPTGEVWLQRPRAREEAPLVYDVVNRQGKWQREVTFPAGAALAGFGEKGAIYASIKGKDGRRTVGRLRLR